MSVRSKALFIVALVTLSSGCTFGKKSTDSYSGADELAAAGEQAAVEQGVDQSAASAVTDSSRTVSSTSIPTAANAAAASWGKENLAQASKDGFSIDLERSASATKLYVRTASADPVYDVKNMSNPPRLVVDLLGEKVKSNRSIPVAGDQFVKGVRVGSHNDKARLVFDLTALASSATAVDQKIDAQKGAIVVTFTSNDATARGAANSPAAAIPAAQPATASIEPPVRSVRAAGQVEEHAASPAAASAEVMVNNVKFNKPAQGAGNVVVSLSNSTAFEMTKTAPSEFVLTIPLATPAATTKVPQVAPKGFPGIRSVRVTEEGANTSIRMFVDSGTDLTAEAQGANIVVKASQLAKNNNANNINAAADLADARGQLEEKKDAVKKEEAKPAADAKSEATPAAKAAPDGGIAAADGSKVYVGRLISLDLQDTDIDNALRIIAEVSNLNIIASDDVSGKVTLRLIDVPWDQALDVILKTNGLDQVKEGNVIRIAPVEKLRAEREALKEAKRAAEELEDLQVHYIRVSYARVTDIKEMVESVLTERGSVTADERTNQIIVKDIGKGQNDAAELIRKLDLRTPQVLLETQIVEASRSILRDLGFQWGFNYTASPATGNATGSVFPNSVQIGGSATAAGAAGNIVSFPAVIASDAGSAISAVLDSADGSRSLTARLSALETEGKVQVISRPQVATVNNKEAEIKSVETVRVRLPDSGTSVATGQGATASGGGSTAFEEIDVGIELRVTPQASPDYYVLLDVNAKSSTFGSTVVDNIPSTLERVATSTVLVKSGQTFALGGVYRINDNDTINGVPFLKDIPFIGHAFRRSKIDKRDEELIFFITPHIVEGSFDPSLM